MADEKREARRPYGAGSLYQRAGKSGELTWYGKWYTAAGRRRNPSLGPVKTSDAPGLTKAEAEKKLREKMGQDASRRSKGRVAETNLPIPKLGERYERRMREKGRKLTSINEVDSYRRTWLDPFFGNRPAEGITGEDIEDLIDLMRAGDRPSPSRYTKPLEEKTIRNIIGTLSAFYNFGMKKGWVSWNPCTEIELPEYEVSPEIKFFEIEEVEALAAAAVPGEYHQVDHAIYITAAKTGLRQGELLGLRWMDVDWVARRVRVRRSWSFRSKEMTTPKSRRSVRSVPLIDDVGGVLDRLFKESAYQAPNDLVFADPRTGEALQPNMLRKRFIRALAAAHLDDTHTFHHLRHTFGTRMAATPGVTMRTLQEWMGHKNISTTERYADYAPAAENELALVQAGFAGRAIAAPIYASALEWLRVHHPAIYADAVAAVPA